MQPFLLEEKSLCLPLVIINHFYYMFNCGKKERNLNRYLIDIYEIEVKSMVPNLP
jgi:hypothetical protein